MRLNFQYAIGIIATLSLLLGLSIGQLHQQHLEIETLKQQPTRLNTVTLRPSTTNSEDIRRYDKIRRCLDQELRNNLEKQIQFEREARLEAVKAKIREGVLREVERDKTNHVFIQEEL